MLHKLVRFAALCIAAGSISQDAHAQRLPQWPLRNGDFSIVTGQAGKLPLPPAYWHNSSLGGEHQFTTEPARDMPDMDADGPPATAVVTTSTAGQGYWYQIVALERGRYRLKVDVSGSPGSAAEIGFSDHGTDSHKTIQVGVTPQTVDIPVTASGKQATVTLCSSTPGTVKFANVNLEAEHLFSAAIPTVGGAPIGGIVLPADPTPAEQYACYELQHYLNRITGQTPGLKGRDPVYPGQLILIGRAAGGQLKSLQGLSSDSYLVGSTGNRLILAGNSDEATLYAVFDFLKQQGCRWITPGELGEVVPKSSTLSCGKLRKEVPAFDVRGGLIPQVDFDIGGREFFVSTDDCFDWAVRNRENVVWLAYGKTSDMGAARGHGWIQGENHSYNLTIAPGDVYFKDHPDWYPLVKGVRMAKDAYGRPTQLCVSNQGLRDYTVKLALQYFHDNPYSKIFAMNPNDGSTYWCECDQCKALDPPGIDWSRNGKDEMFMTDRALDYANYVADKISKVYPDHFVELYAYGCTREPPAKTRVSKNVLIHYAYWGGPLNEPFNYSAEPNRWQEYRRHLDGWLKAGAIHLDYYNYLDWQHQNAPLFWFNNIVQVLRGLKDQYHFMGRLGETETSIQSSPTLYAVMTAADWNPHIDYKPVIRDVCDKFYGKAADTMYAYNMLMDHAVMASFAWRKKDWVPNDQLEFSMATLEQGRQLLDQADALVRGGEPVFEQRVALARFSHAVLTYSRALNEPAKTIEVYRQAQEAFTSANDLRRLYGIRVWYRTFQQLQTFQMPPMPGDPSFVADLPLEWNFKLDPTNVGLNTGWYNTVLDATWKKIRTDRAWTDQGYDYHGVAWYSTRFNLPSEAAKTKLVLHFAAVDGYCDIYLDGTKIGEQKKDIVQMWDKPFDIDLPAGLDPAVAHRLVLRVEKQNFAAGIWKPVSILKAVSS